MQERHLCNMIKTLKAPLLHLYIDMRNVCEPLPNGR